MLTLWSTHCHLTGSPPTRQLFATKRHIRSRSLFDLAGFKRTRFGRDVALGFALLPASLVFFFGGIYAASWLLYWRLAPPYLLGDLPLPAALYGMLVWPFIWGLTEQMTYNAYLVSRFQVLCGVRACRLHL